MKKKRISMRMKEEKLYARQRAERQKILDAEVARCAEWAEGPDHKHGKACRLRIFCEKFIFDSAEPDWSEVTPGNDLLIACELFDPIDYWRKANGHSKMEGHQG